MRSSPIVTVFISAIGVSFVNVIRNCNGLKIWHGDYSRCCDIVWLSIIMWLRIRLVFPFDVVHLQMVWQKGVLVLMRRLRERSCSLHTFPLVTVSVVTSIVTHCRIKWHRRGNRWSRWGTNGRRYLGGLPHWLTFVRVLHFYKLPCLQNMTITR